MDELNPKIHLVLTAALKKEMPYGWIMANNVPVHTLAALKSGALHPGNSHHAGVMVVITGTGPEESKEAALWIRDNLNPLYVINIGTCGLINREYPIGKWITPQYVADESGERLKLDMRSPVRYPEDTINVRSLLTVGKAVIDKVPMSWKSHDAVDMECHAQAKVFCKTRTSFHCLKFGTDYSDQNTLSDFHKNLETFSENMKYFLNFIRGSENGIRITAIVPVYNRQNTIKRAVDSVLSQSSMPEEIIVVDDCSSDRTWEILKGYGGKITSISLTMNSGPSAARNAGISNTRTEWVAFLDSDDCWERDKLKKQVEYLRKYPFYEILQSEEIWIRNGVRVNPCKHHKKPAGWVWEQSLERCLISPSAVLVKKSLLEQYGGFDECLPVCEDYDLWLRISRHHPVGLEPVLSVIKYGGHEDQLSRKTPAMDRFRVMSLLNILEKEQETDYRQKMLFVLKKKLKILIKGYEKRNNLKDAREYRKILDALLLYQEDKE